MSAATKTAPWAAEGASAGKTISVGCKLPNGLWLDLTIPGQPQRRFRLKGTNSARVIGGFGITENVPEDFFNEWMRLNKGLPFVTNGLVFAHKQLASVKTEAKARASMVNGLEGINKDKPGSGIKPLNKDDPDGNDDDTTGED